MKEGALKLVIEGTSVFFFDGLNKVQVATIKMDQCQAKAVAILEIDPNLKDLVCALKD